MKTAVLLFFSLFTFSIYAQSDLKTLEVPQNEINFKHIIKKSNSKNYNTILNDINNFYVLKPELKEKDQKKFSRWQQFMENRLDANGDIVNVNAKTRDAFFKQQSEIKKTLNTTNTDKKSASLSWTNISHEVSKYRGRVDCFTVDPANSEIIYAGANTGGVWKTVNGGDSWVPLTDALPALGVASIVIDPNSPTNNRRLFVFVGDGGWGTQYHTSGVFVSNDGGDTWQMTGLQFDETDVYSSARKLIMDPTNSNILYAMLWKDIYKTVDAGQTWTRINLDNKLYSYGFYDLEISPADHNTLYVIEDEAIFHRSTDGGATWSKTNIPGTSTRGVAINIAVTPANPNAVYFLGMDTNTTDDLKFHGIYKSIDNGASFNLLTDKRPLSSVTGNVDGSFFNQRYGIAQIAVSPTDENTLFIGSLRTFKYDKNTATLINVDSQINHVDIRQLVFFGNRLFNGNDGGLDITDDLGNTWKDIASNMLIKQIYSLTTKPNSSNQIIIGTQDNGASIVQNGLEERIGGGDVFTIAPSKVFERTYLMSGNLFYIYETNPIAYKNFQRMESGSRPFSVIDSYIENGNSIDHVVVSDAKNIKRAYINQSYEIDFQNLTNDNFDYYWKYFATSEVNTDVFYGLGRNNKMIKSVNLNAANPDFIDISASMPTVTNDFDALEVSNINQDHIWIGASGYTANEKMYYSENGGQSWLNISTGLPNTPVNCMVTQISDGREIIYAGTDVGVYFYINGESQNWSPYYVGSLPGVLINSLDFNKKDNILTAGTWGRGIWQIAADGTTLSVDSVEPQEELSLIAYPNPVTDIIQLKTNFSSGNDIIISIYDVTSKLVYSRKLTNTQINEPVSIDMTHFNAGTYILHYNNLDSKKILKIIKN